MGIEYRRGRPYYYRKVRRGGRVVSVYEGGSPVDLIAGACKAIETVTARATAPLWRAERDALDAEDRRVADFCAGVDRIVAAALEASGFHRHKRGEWRRRRTMNLSEQGSKPPARVSGETRDLVDRAYRGDESCAPELRAIFCDPVRGTELAEIFGSPAADLQRRLIGGYAGKNLLFREGAERMLAKVREDLEGPDASPIERLLAERAALCWFQVHRYEALASGVPDQDLRRAEFLQRLTDRAHKRFLSALKALATVRKLGPILGVADADQVCVAER